MGHCRDCRYSDFFGSDGRCKTCWGSGKDAIQGIIDGGIETLTGISSGKANCKVCYGTGQCQTCGGTGDVKDEGESNNIIDDDSTESSRDFIRDYAYITSNSTDYVDEKEDKEARNFALKILSLGLLILVIFGTIKYNNYRGEKLRLEKIKSSRINLNGVAYAKTNDFITVFKGTSDFEALKNHYAVDKLYPKQKVFLNYRIRNTSWISIKYFNSNRYRFGFVKNEDLSLIKHYDRTYNGKIYFRLNIGHWYSFSSEDKKKLKKFFKSISHYNDKLEVVIYDRHNTTGAKNLLFSEIGSLAEEFELGKFHRNYAVYKDVKFHNRNNLIIIKTYK